MLTGLEALAATDWSRLHHAYRRATDTPDHLRALLEDEKRAIRRSTICSLRSSMETPWTATGPVARVVAGLLADERTGRVETIRAELLEFLVCVAEVAASVQRTEAAALLRASASASKGSPARASTRQVQRTLDLFTRTLNIFEDDLTLADLGRVDESIFHAAPDMAWNFYTVSARLGHERNLVRPYFASNCRDKVRTDFEYHAAVLGLSFCDYGRIDLNRVTAVKFIEVVDYHKK